MLARITSLIDEDFVQAVAYMQRQAFLGNAFEDAINQTILTIQANPLAFRERKAAMRVALVKRFRYSIVYTYNEAEHHIRIIGFYAPGMNWSEYQ